jgi:hypothetical protein
MTNPVEQLDEYWLLYLARNLATTRRVAELHWLLALRTDEGANAWFEARDARGQTAGYLDDVRLARDLADAAARRTRGPRRAAAVGLQCRYALILATINGLAGNVQPQLSAALVACGRWTNEQAITYASPLEQDERLRVILDSLERAAGEQQDQLARQALALAGDLAEDVERSGDLVVTLVERLPEPFLPQVLGLIRTIANSHSRTQALKTLIPRLPTAFTREALRLAGSIRPEDLQSEALAAVAGRLPEPEQSAAFQAALDAARALGPPPPNGWEIASHHASVLVTLAGYLPTRLLPELLHIADTVVGKEYPPWLKVWVTVLWRGLAGSQPREVFHKLRELPDNSIGTSLWQALEVVALELATHRFPGEALEAVARISSEHDRAEAIGKLAAVLPSSYWPALLEEVERLSNDCRPAALGGLARACDPSLAPAVFAAVKAMADELWQRKALVEVAPELPEPLRTSALRMALDAIKTSSHSLDELAQLAPFLPSSMVAEALEDARAKATLDFEWEAFGRVAGRQAELGAPQAALDQVRSIQDPQGRATALAALVPHLPPELIRDTHPLIAPPIDETDRVRSCVTLAPYLPADLAMETLEAVRRLADPVQRIEALTNLAPYLPEPGRDLALSRALAAVGDLPIDKPKRLESALQAVLEQLPSTLHETAIKVISKSFDHPGARTATLTMVARHALGAAADRAWQTAIDSTRPLPADARAKVLIEFAAEVPHALHAEVLDQVLNLPQYSRGLALAGVARFLHPHLHQRALSAARAMRGPANWLPALAGLLPYLPPTDQQQTVDWAHRCFRDAKQPDPETLIGVTTELAPYDRSAARKGRLDTALHAALRLEGAGRRARALAWLASHRSKPLRDRIERQALNAAAETQDQEFPAAVTGLALWLSPARLPEILSLVESRLSTLTDGDDRRRVMDLEFGLADGLAVLARRAAHAGQDRTALTAVRTLPKLGDDREEVLRQLARMLPVAALREAVRLASDFATLGELAIQLARRGAWPDALAVVHEMVDRSKRGRSSGNDPIGPLVRVCGAVARSRLPALVDAAHRLDEKDQPQVLAVLISRLPGPRKRQVLLQALHRPSTERLTALGPYLTCLPARTVVQLWGETLHRAEQSNRAEILPNVRALAPALAKVCGPKTAVELYREILDIGRW